MSDTATEAKLAKPAPKTNHIGLTREDYKGGPTTLCAGCGHNAISNHIIQAAYDAGIDPVTLGKFSGIGCSSKTPAYFKSKAHAVNTVHGRMPSIATGALIANHNLVGLAVSGDGDTASIGMGQFVHLIRRNVDMVYIIENNGVYGLTKGQFSATADIGSVLKKGVENPFEAIDLCGLAVELGCGFVARSFSGDKKQLVPLIQAAFSHKGTAVIDVVSPCVTFNDHEGSTKSYDFVKDHDKPLQEIDFIPYYEEIDVDVEKDGLIDAREPCQRTCPHRSPKYPRRHFVVLDLDGSSGARIALADLLQRLGTHVRLATADPFQGLQIGASMEKPFAGHQFVEDDGGREEIAS